MLDMPQVDDIRRLDAEGHSVSEIARITGHDRKTVRKFLGEVDFSPRPPVRAARPSKLDPYKPRIDGMLEADRHAWRKQRHTARRIYDLIREDGYDGGYTTVQQYVKERRGELRSGAREAFLDLEWQPGTAQVDFDAPGGRERGCASSWPRSRTRACAGSRCSAARPRSVFARASRTSSSTSAACPR